MINLKKEILKLLKEDDELNILLDKKIFNLTTPDDVKPPYLIFFEIHNEDTTYCDNTNLAGRCVFSFDIFGGVEVFKIAKRVNLILRSKRYKRIDAMEMYDSQTKLIHKNLIYEKNELEVKK